MSKCFCPKVLKEEVNKNNRNKWKKWFWISLILFTTLDIIGEGYMLIGFLIGWIVGLMTITCWQKEKK